MHNKPHSEATKCLLSAQRLGVLRGPHSAATKLKISMRLRGLNDPIKNDVELNTILCNSLIGGVEKLIKEIRSVT